LKSRRMLQGSGSKIDVTVIGAKPCPGKGETF
jgi:hypothetical protein